MHTSTFQAILLSTLLTSFFAAEAVLVVNQPTSIIYEVPEERAHIEDVIRYGTPVVVTEENGDWVHVAYIGLHGWVKRKELVDVEENTLKRTNAIVGCRGAYVYPAADTELGTIFYLPFESAVEVIQEFPEQYNRWLQVRLQDNQLGYMQRSCLIFPKVDQVLSIPEMIALSKNFLNLNYLWGGTSSLGYDCSGFVQMLYRQMGITLPRNSYQQAVDSRFVTVQEAKAGDLVFFQNRLGKVVHVGMMINAQEFIHAFTKQEAWICVSLLDERFKNSYFYYGYEIRRFVASSSLSSSSCSGY